MILQESAAGGGGSDLLGGVGMEHRTALEAPFAPCHSAMHRTCAFARHCCGTAARSIDRRGAGPGPVATWHIPAPADRLGSSG